MRWRALWLVAVPCALRAEEAVRFEYRAPEGCPDSVAFMAQVRERTARGRWAEPTELARTFSVVIATEEGGFSGRVEFLDDAGAAVSRSVRGEHCDAIVSSLALITALALEATPPEEAPTPPPEPPKPVAPEPRVVKTPRPAPVARPTPRAVTSTRLGLTGGYAGAEHAPRLGLLGQLDFRGDWSLRLNAHYGWDDFVADAQGRRAKLRALGVETSICPWRYALRDWGFTPCALVDVGALRVAGVRDEQLTSARADTIFWAAVGAEVRLGWEPRAPYWAEARVAGVVPLRQGYRFTFENPHGNAYEVPTVAVAAGLAGGVRFW
jgi:hypothetical protein